MGPFGRSGWLRGRSFGDLGLLLGESWSLLESLGALLRPPASLVRAVWLALESIWKAFGGCLEVILELGARLWSDLLQY